MLYNLTKQKIIARQPLTAGGFGGRLRGLMFRASFPAGCDALLLYPCRAVHTFFMRFSIDVLLLDKNLRVIGLYAPLPPGRCSACYSGAVCCVELPAGVIENSLTSAGDQLALIDSARSCSISASFEKNRRPQTK
ncbi:MAG: hypothetical protein DDT21_00271 [Syntrophomonadaceae bacterium]|nr:hypothetical protein [Bacillota bacterium]